MKQLVVVGGIIEYNGKILCMQRNKGKYDYTSYKYEFPGGKLEEGETYPQALMRELREEMDMKVFVEEKDYIAEVFHEYPDFSIHMKCYICKPETDRFIRKEHINHVWLKPEELDSLDWAEADKPIVKAVEDYYLGNNG